MTTGVETDVWAESTVANEFYVQLGKRLDAAVNRGDLRPCINNRAVRWGHILIAESVLAPLTKADIRELHLLTGDVLVCEGGEIGRASVWDDELPEAYFLNTLHRLRSKGRYEPRLLAAFFERWAATGEFSALVGKSSIAHLTKENLLRVRIPMPTRAEQEHLVETLLAVDQMVESLARLISKKQEIKQGMMQQLLTGRTRLPGFTDAWEYRRVAEMGDVLAGKALNALGAGTLRPYLRTKNVLDGLIDLKDLLWMPMTDAEFERFRIARGDVLLNEGQSLDLVGRCSLYNGELGTPCAMQNQLLRFRARAETSPEFTAHLFRYCQQTGVFASIATQTTSVAHLGSSRFSNLRLLWPVDPLEQAAIADVLSDMDAEIAALQTRFDKALAIKQGMMQQLLTGRTRLPVQEPAA